LDWKDKTGGKTEKIPINHDFKPYENEEEIVQ